MEEGRGPEQKRGEQLGGCSTEPSLHIEHRIRSLPSRSPQPSGGNKHPNRYFQYHGVGQRKAEVGNNHRCPGGTGEAASACFLGVGGGREREREDQGKHLQSNAKVSSERARVELMCAHHCVS